MEKKGSLLIQGWKQIKQSEATTHPTSPAACLWAIKTKLTTALMVLAEIQY